MPPFVAETNAAHAALQAWAATPVAHRLAIVRRARQSLPAARAELCEAVYADVARPAAELLATDILPLAAGLRFLERRAATILRPRRVPFRDRPLWLWGQRDTILRDPLGVVGVIGTWNYPLLLNGVPIAQALVAGNAVLWKPSEFGGRSAAVLHRLFLDAGVPADLFQRLPATREAGPQLADAAVDHVVFTGAARTGEQLARRLGERLIPSTLELSGVDAMVVRADADLALAAKAAWFGLRLNRGQTCVAVRRLFVEQPAFDKFVATLASEVQASPPMTLVQPQQVEQVARLTTDAIARGARVVAPPDLQSNDPRACVPRLLVGGSPDMAVCVDESFGPVAAVLPFADEADLLRQVERCRYGLSASVFSADIPAARRLAARLPAGSVCVNDLIAPTAHPAVPFGGRGRSGWGVTRGAEGLLAMTTPRVVSETPGRLRVHYDPPTEAVGDILAGLLAVQNAPTWAGRWAGLKQLIAAGRRYKPG